MQIKNKTGTKKIANWVLDILSLGRVKPQILMIVSLKLMRMLYEGRHGIVIIELPTGQCDVTHWCHMMTILWYLRISWLLHFLFQIWIKKSEISWQWSPDAEVYLETIDMFTLRNYKRCFDLISWQEKNSDGSRISQGAGPPTPGVEQPTHYFGHFPWKLHKNQKRTSLALPPLIRQCGQLIPLK